MVPNLSFGFRFLVPIQRQLYQGFQGFSIKSTKSTVEEADIKERLKASEFIAKTNGAFKEKIEQIRDMKTENDENRRAEIERQLQQDRKLQELQQVYIDIYTNNLSKLILPTENFLESLSQFELEILNSRLGYTIMGDPETIRRELIEFQQMYQVDELIVLSNIYELSKEIQSYEILKHVVDELFE